MAGANIFIVEVLAHAKFAAIVLNKPDIAGADFYYVVTPDGRALGREELGAFAQNPQAFLYADGFDEIGLLLERIRSRNYGTGMVFSHGLTSRQARACNALRDALGCSTAYFCYGGELYSRLAAKGWIVLHDRRAMQMQWYTRLTVVWEALRAGIYWRDPTADRHSARFLREVGLVATSIHADHAFLERLTGRKLPRTDYLYPVAERVFEPVADLGARAGVFVNHSASITGNHDYVIDRLALIVAAGHEVIVPVSYGNPRRKRAIAGWSRKLRGATVRILDTYLSEEDYIRLCDTAVVAVYGHRRQEAVGNIMIMLARGVRVYLRKTNPLLPDLRELGFLVFSLEEDLEQYGFRPLDSGAVARNQASVREFVSREAWVASYTELILRAKEPTSFAKRR